MSVTTANDPSAGAPTAEDGASTEALARGRWRPSANPNLLAAVVCAALGAVSILTLPSLPSYDPFAWIIWGHELAHHIIGPHQPFITSGASSWKPLPVLFTTIFGFFGASVKLWVAFSRAVGLFGLYAAYRVGSALGSTERWRLAGPIAGALAALGIFLTAEWTHYMFRATSEPMVVTATLYAIERHLAGKRLTAFASGIALALMRPESGVFVALYALWCFITMGSVWRRLMLVAGLVLVPLAWTVPTAIGSGNALLASSHARAYNGNLGGHPLLEVLKRATNLTVWPVIIAAGAMTLLALRTRDRLVLVLAASALGYVAIVEAMTAAHYPGLERFMLPAAAIACALAGAAVGRFATLAGAAVARVTGGRAAGAVSLAICAALVAVAIPFFAGRVQAARREPRISRHAVGFYDTMIAATRRAGGDRRIFPCTTSRAAINHSLQPSLAWALRVPLTRIRPVTRTDSSLKVPALAFYAPTNQITGGRPHQLVAGLHGRLVTRYKRWKIYRVTRADAPALNACVGR